MFVCQLTHGSDIGPMVLNFYNAGRASVFRERGPENEVPSDFPTLCIRMKETGCITCNLHGALKSLK